MSEIAEAEIFRYGPLVNLSTRGWADDEVVSVLKFRVPAGLFILVTEKLCPGKKLLSGIRGLLYEAKNSCGS